MASQIAWGWGVGMGGRVRGMVMGSCTCPNQLFSLVQWSLDYKATP